VSGSCSCTSASVCKSATTNPGTTWVCE
jgi:hypothetical protein